MAPYDALRRRSVPDPVEERAAYGDQVVAAVAEALSSEFGRGFRRSNLYYMIEFASAFPDPEIVHALRGRLSWTHFRELIAIDDPLKRDFYAELCRVERWSTRTLEKKMDGMLFERTAIAKRPAAIVERALDALRDEDQEVEHVGIPKHYIGSRPWRPVAEPTLGRGLRSTRPPTEPAGRRGCLCFRALCGTPLRHDVSAQRS